MRRREFITLIGVTATWPIAARAQQSGKVWRIGSVSSSEVADQLLHALTQKLDVLGYIQGKNIVVSSLTVPPQPKAIEGAITRLIPDIDILVVWGTIGGAAAKRITSTIPTVFLSVGAPVDIGLVQSLAHPGGNLTGVTFEAATDTYAKRLQMLKEIVPTLERVAVLGAHGDPNVSFAIISLEKAAPAMNVGLMPVYVESGNDLPTAFDQMRRNRIGGLIVVAGGLTFVNSKLIAELSLAHRLPSCHGFRESIVAGGLVSLGPDLFAIARQGAVYLDKIIRGAKPADLPVEQPDRYEIYINLKTARTLGLEVPAPLLARAEAVIE
ncbi:ABC transporter substrate-binding protein [Bradyrhizobium sp. sBnM-33]|uniref:ABC transporter substrate-binding protein n=1 Tax=Bradyrhizobium sp. sBnM-33 TaxID=2831780 RepID=UPI001BCACB70|nr:ABC transporter substrate-binding protein [Bradyrhizobium sp. sBnM-33]WOH48221.1 ABC transporter substrate-binding protein [Bradyrhizobium sp. sBnM-33]